jgi:hypothetical protein
MAVPRETAAQRKKRIEALLADYDNRSREFNKLKKIVEGLKAQLEGVPRGKYGEWELSDGTPREITDANALKVLLAQNDLEMPTRMSTPPIVVRPVTK